MNVDKQSFFQSISESLAIAPTQSSANLSPAFIMLQAQMLLAENYDSQLRDAANEIKFLKKVISESQKNINHVQKFMAQPSHDYYGKQIIDATASQMSDLMGSLGTISHDSKNETMRHDPIELIDLEGRHNLDSDQENWDGVTSTAEAKAFFGEVETLFEEDLKVGGSSAREKAYELGRSKNMQIGFIHNNKTYNNTNEKHRGIGKAGEPIFSVFIDFLEKLLEVMRANMQDVESDLELVKTKVDDLSEKRRQALESANQIVKKMNEAQTNTVNKM